MKNQGCRSDFISDGSSDDDEPVVGSLWDRIARKRGLDNAHDTDVGALDLPDIPALDTKKISKPETYTDESNSAYTCSEPFTCTSSTYNSGKIWKGRHVCIGYS